MIPIKSVQTSTTYLGMPGKIKPTNSYEVLNINDNGGFDTDYSITFRITEACDLHCSYCHWREGAHYKFEDIIGTIDKLFEFFQKQKFRSVVFYYHGGEATRHPKVVEILKHIKTRSTETGINAYNEMQTNLTTKESVLRAILPYCDLFNITFHYLELKARPQKLEAFNRNYKILQEEGKPIHNLGVMLEYIDDVDKEEFYGLIEDYLTYDKIINSEMVYRFGYNFNYNAETEKQHQEFYKKHNKTEQRYRIDDKEYSTNDLFQVGLDCTGWHCDAGKQSITINGDGNVFNCGIQMTSYIQNFSKDTYTNLLTDTLAVTKMVVLFNSGTICRWDYCGGDFYLHRKVRK